MVALDDGVTQLAILSDECQHAHTGNIRRDDLHKITSEISKNHAMTVIEDLRSVTCRNQLKARQYRMVEASEQRQA
jgi:hypothetical protein